MDRKLLDLLCSPDTRQPLLQLDGKALDTVNRAIESSEVLRVSGERQQQPLREALLTQDRSQLFRVEDGIPVLLAEEAILTAQISDFPSA